MANLRNPPPIEMRPPGCLPSTWKPGASHPHPHPPHACTPAALGAEAKDYNARRFHLASWLLERHGRQGAQRASAALILALVDILLATVLMLLFFLAAQFIDPSLWLLRLLLLAGASLALLCVIVSALFALLSAVRLRPAGGTPSPTSAGVFFQNGAGLPAGPLPSEAGFRERFRQATQQQMLDGAIAELYVQARRRARQERWLRWAVVSLAVGLLLFTLLILGMFLGLIL
jgi:hypothetical protein